MHPDFKPHGVKVKPRSVNNIRGLALMYRRLLFKCEDNKSLNVVKSLEIILGKLGVVLIIKTMEEMGNCEAAASPDTLELLIREDVYDALHNNDGRARFTICHEIGHLTLHENIALARANNGGHKIFEDSEWQANTFASELLMPFNICKTINSAIQVQIMYQTSYEASAYRLMKLESEKPTKALANVGSI
ncbi:MAG: ImmA/IrrE family metallo-endopeptidase [Gammaproteobacteria bacterium]|nr:ImmA/IrrE family metallo-endopeptidase [Gammaproteobacteria bacterium]